MFAHKQGINKQSKPTKPQQHAILSLELMKKRERDMNKPRNLKIYNSP